MLIQYTENGVQTGDTFAQAIRYLRIRHFEFHKNDVAICGTEEEPRVLVVTTDGHASRYTAEVTEAYVRANIRPNIRKGQTSWVTQMLDQV